MIGFRTTSDDINRDIQLEEHREQFTVEFNRYYFTKQYEKAFDLCINNMAKPENRKYVHDKAMLAIEKLTNRIEMTDKSRINQNKVVDALIQFGHKNMRVNGNEIKVGQSKISVNIGNNVKIEGKSNISIFTTILIVCIVLILGIFTIAFGNDYFIHVGIYFGIINEIIYRFLFWMLHSFISSWDLTILLGFILFLAAWLSLYYFFTKFIKQHQTYIREIATSILYEYNKL